MDISKYVDLRSYSSSKGFVGYVEYVGENPRSGTDAALDNLERFLCLTSGESIVLTTLAFKGRKKNLKGFYGYKEADFRTYVEPAVHSEMVSECYEDSCSFRVLPFINGNFRDSGLRSACYIVMALDGVAGHLFIFSRAASVIFYPHDDTGFGVIAVEKDNLSSVFFDFFKTDAFKINLEKDYW
ncbi:hypothetical protein RYA98_06840 [Pseudomonas syringae]|nr:hypothetical protein [Pseudomonas syringae]